MRLKFRGIYSRRRSVRTSDLPQMVQVSERVKVFVDDRITTGWDLIRHPYLINSLE